MTIHDISPVTGLTPKKKFFAEVDDTLINVDGAIKLLDAIDNERTRTIRKAFRHQLSLVRLEGTQPSPEKEREEAFFRALNSLGVTTHFTPVKGTMD